MANTNANNADIKLLFGVEGGSSVSNGSGKNILAQLNEIATEINKNPIGISFKVDDKSVNEIRTQVQDLVKSMTVGLSGGLKFDAALPESIQKAGAFLTSMDSSLSKISADVNKLSVSIDGAVSAIDSIRTSASGSTAGVQELVTSLSSALDVINKIEQKEFSVTNVFDYKKTGEASAQQLTLYKDQAVSLLRYIEELQNRIYDIGSKLAVVMNSGESGASNLFEKLGSFKGSEKYLGDIAGASTISQVNKVIGTLGEFRRVYEGAVNTAISKGVNVALPDATEVEKSILKIQEYDKSVGELEKGFVEAAKSAAGVKVDNMDEVSNSIKESADSASKLSGVNETLGEVSTKLDALREKVEQTFDFSAIKPDATGILDVINTIQEKVESIKLTFNPDVALADGTNNVPSIESEIEARTELANTVEHTASQEVIAEQNVENAINNVVESVETANATLSSGTTDTIIDDIPVSAEKASGAIDSLKEALHEAEDEMVKSASKPVLMDAKDINNAEIAITRLKDTLDVASYKAKELDKAFSDSEGGSSDYSSRVAESISSLDEFLSEVKSGSVTVSGYSDKIASLRNSTNILTTDIKSQTRALKDKIRSDKDENKAAAESIRDQKRLNNILRETNTLTNKIKNAQDSFTAAKNGNAETQTAYNSLDGYIAQLRQLKKDLELGKISLEEYGSELSKIKSNYSESISTIAKYGKNTKSLGDTIGGLVKKFGSWLSITTVIMKTVQTMKQMVTQSIELDTAMTQLRIVTDETDATYEKFSVNVAKTAQALGASMTDIINATTTYARLGYTLDESASLSKVTAMLQQVGDIDAQSAQDAVTAIIKAFDIDASNADNIMAVGDKLVDVGNNFPVSVSQLAEGINNAASALHASGNTLEQSIALLTAATTISQNASKASTGLRTISARIRNVKTELEDLGEAMTTAKYEEVVAALTHYNVALTDANGEFRSTYDIIKDIAAQWDNLTTMEQSALATELAGNRQQEVLIALIEQFQEASGAMDAMANSAGYLDAAYSEYLDSAQARINGFKAAFMALSSDVINSETIQSIVSIGTGVLNVVDGLARTNKLLPAIVASLLTIKGINLAKNTFKPLLDVAKNIALSTGSEVVANDALKASVSSLNVVENQYVATMLRKKLLSQGLSADVVEQTLATYGLATAETAATASTNGLSAGFTLLKATNPIGWISILISLIVTVVPLFIQFGDSAEKASDKLEEAQSRLENISSDIKRTASNFRNLKSDMDTAIPRFVELAEGVNSLGENISLTDEEYSEFIDLNNKIAESFDVLNLGLDSNGNYMVALDYKAQDLKDTLYGLVEAERAAANVSIASGIGDAFDAYNDAVSGSDDVVSVYEKNIEAAQKLSKVLGQTFDYKVIGSKYSYGENGIGEITRESVSDMMEVATQLGIQYDILAGKFNNPSIVFKNNELASDLIDGYIAEQKRQITDAEGKVDDLRVALNETLSAWVQLDDSYPKDTGLQRAISAIISSADWNELGLTTEEQIKAYIKNNILTPFSEAAPELSTVINSMLDVSSGFSSGSYSVKQYVDSIANLRKELSSIGFDETLISVVVGSITDSDVESKFEELKDVADEFLLNYVSTLSGKDFDIAYSIIAENGSMTIDELKQKMEDLKLQASDFVNVLTFDDMFEGMETAAENVDKIVSSLEKLQEGTALTKSELVKLAQEFPELLKQSNLFTDGSIAGQRKMLQVALNSYEEEYDAQIDTKVRELDASVVVINHQIEVERQKLESINKIRGMTLNNNIEQQAEFIKEIGKLNDLQGKNYVEMSNGELRVNEQALNEQLQQGREFGVSAQNDVWVPYAQLIAKSHEVAYIRSLKSTEEFGRAVREALIEGNLDMASAVAEIRLRNGDAVPDFDYSYISFGSGNLTVNSKNVNEWADNYINDVNQRINELLSLKKDTENAKKNLEALKKATLSDIYAGSGKSGSGSSSSSSSSTDKLTDNEFKRLYEEHQHLVNMEMETHADFLAWLKSAYVDAYNNGYITLSEYYKYEEQIYKDELELVEKSKDSLNALAEYRHKMLKKEKEEQKDLLNEKLKSLKEFYDKQKQLLQDQYDEEKYLDEQSQKRKAISDIKTEILRLSNDDSAYTQKRLVELNQSLLDAQKELSDFERENALETAQLELDKMYEQDEALLNREIEEIDAVLNDPNTLFNQALNDIKGNSYELYQSMVDFAKQQGEDTSSVVALWETFNDSLSEYNKYYKKLFENIQTSNYYQNDIDDDGVITADDANKLLTEYLDIITYGKTLDAEQIKKYDIDRNGIVDADDANALLFEYLDNMMNNTGMYSSTFKSSNGSEYAVINYGDTSRILGRDVIASAANTITGAVASSGGTSAYKDNLSKASNVANITMGDIIINGNADNQTVSEIRRQQRRESMYIAREVERLSK